MPHKLKIFYSLLFKAFLFLFLGLLSVNSYATHVQGGDITIKCLGGNQYEIRLSLYRDCAGVNAPNSASVTYSSASCGINQNVTLNKIPGTGVEVTPICPSASSRCTGGSNPGVQEYIYSAIVTLQPCNDWVVGYRLCCRNNAIQTINNPGGQNMYIQSTINTLDFPCNNTPTFTNKPVPFICVGQPYCFNNGALDIDGDSLYYSMTEPLHNVGVPVTYTVPYSSTNPLSTSLPITFNPATGDICVTPDQIQVTVFAVLVQEYRNGVLIGSIRRDIQVRTIPCSNNNPYLNGINNTGSYSLSECVGNPINFDIPSFDADAGDNLTLTWNNGIAGGTFTPGTGNRPTANFSWTPTQADIRSTPHCFTVTVQDDNCPYQGSQTYAFCITVGGVTTTTTSSNANCNASNGRADVLVTSGIGPFTYLWSTGGTTDWQNGLSGGSYNVTTTDSLGCSVTDTIIVGVNPGGNARITSYTDVLCNGANDGKITAALTGPAIVPPFTYIWTPAVAGNTPTASGLAPGTYLVEITDSQGCSDTISQTITEPTPLSTSVTPIHVGCFGASTGSVSAIGIGGTAPYTYLWMPGGYTSDNISSLPVGTYTVTVTDDNGCTTSGSAVIDQPDELQISSTVVNANCGQADGSASVTGSGGFPTYSWSWSDGQTGPNASNLASGTYIVTITDLNFCTKTAPVTITDNAGPVAGLKIVNNVSCSGGSNGNIYTTISGGTTPYTYLWSNGQTTPTAVNLPIGVYSLTVTDANGCSAVVDTTITEPPLLNGNIIGTNPICFGGSTGSVSMNPVGGVPPYTYLWAIPGNPTTASVNNLTAGTYTVTVTDANGCNINRSVTLNNPPTVTTTIAKTNALCQGSCDGVAVAIVGNGQAPYTYTWNDPLNQTRDTAKFLCAGTYTVNIVDNNGCTSQAVTTINEPTQLVSNISSKGNLVCYQECIGFAQVTASGGTAPYSYSWSNGDTVTTATNLCAGTYTSTVTDANGCTSIINVIITQPTELIATVTGTDIKCNGICDGTGNIAFSGGTAPYSFVWMPGLQTTNNPVDLCPGQNIAEITDANGCSVTDTITLIESLPILITVQSTNVSNCGQANGGACVTPSGGLPPYSYVWNDSAVSNTSCIANVLAGTYSVDVTDAVGCLRTEVVNINDLSAPTLTIDGHTDLLCYGDTNGTATTTITGGVTPYTILWTPDNQTVQNPTNLKGGTHTMTVIDSAGCSVSQSVTVLEPPKINLVITSHTDVSCFNACDGTTNASAIGGTGALSFLWDDPLTQSTANAIDLCDGDYMVTVTDDNNCQVKDSVIITQPDELVIDSNSFEHLKCFQDNTGSIFVSVTGGTPFYIFNWTPNVSSAPTANTLAAGNYALQVVDQNGCTTDENWVLTEPPLLTGNPSFEDATCSMNNGNASITVSGGTLPYSYQWNDPGLQTTAVAASLFAGNYTVNVVDNNGCSITENYTITDSPGPEIDSVTSTPVLCYGGSTGTASVYLTNGTGTPPFTYAWAPTSQIFQNISGLSKGIYSVIVTDSNGCTAGGNIAVDEPVLLELEVSDGITICHGDTAQIYGQATGGTLPYTYTWTGGPPLSGPGVHDVFPTTTTTYIVDVTDANNCAAGPLSITVTVTDPLVVAATDIAICDGDSGTISASSLGGNGDPHTYSWDNGVNTASQLVGPSFSPLPIKYVVTVNDGCSSPAYDTSYVTVYNNPIIDSISVVDVLCYGGNTGRANVYMNTTVGQAPYIYDWGFVSQGNTTITGLMKGNYSVVVTDNNGCSVTDSITVNEPDLMVLTVFGDSICYGDTATMSASVIGGISPYTYSWGGVTATGPGPHQVSPTITTFYSVGAVDANGCNVAPQNVRVKVGPPLSITASDATVCGGDNALINAIPQGGSGTYTYSWDNGVNTQGQTVSTNLNDSLLTFIITLNDGCSSPAYDTAYVFVKPAPSGAILAYPKEGCSPLDVLFEAVSSNVSRYYWNFGDNTPISSTALDSVHHTYIKHGWFDVSLLIVSLDGCSTIVDSMDYIHVFPQPIADFVMTPNPTTIVDNTIQFKDKSYFEIGTSFNIVSWEWDFGGLAISLKQHPEYTFPVVAGTHVIQLEVVDINGCKDTITKLLMIKEDWALFIPNSFTPDGDGINDGFGPKGYGILDDNYTFLIFDRWGELFFETHTKFEPWDGTYKGSIVEEEVYVWHLFFRDVHGEDHAKIGRVTLIK
ncbi:MAG: gliding motility-associated C-terminal domain-containing protein [Vicingus serpentipes]|nr:gliding motility-associated C-terminal domain-containing protein [Vicingus serpentipes]